MSRSVRLLRSNTVSKLEKKIQKFCGSCPIKIIDIKYQSSQRVDIEYRSVPEGNVKVWSYEYSALIIFECSGLWKRFVRWFNDLPNKNPFEIEL